MERNTAVQGEMTSVTQGIDILAAAAVRNVFSPAAVLEHEQEPFVSPSD